MALTRDSEETVAERIKCDPGFARALLNEASTLFLNGEPETARLILRDLVNATVGFEVMADAIPVPAKSLHRMLSVRGNPSMNYVASIYGALAKLLNVRLQASGVEGRRVRKALA